MMSFEPLNTLVFIFPLEFQFFFYITCCTYIKKKRYIHICAYVYCMYVYIYLYIISLISQKNDRQMQCIETNELFR